MLIIVITVGKNRVWEILSPSGLVPTGENMEKETQTFTNIPECLVQAALCK